METTLLFVIECLVYIYIMVVFCFAFFGSPSDSEFIQSLISLLLPFTVKNFRWLVLISGVTGYYYVHMNPTFVLEFFANMKARVLLLIDYLINLFLVVVSCVMLVIAQGAIENTRIWWPEVIHTSIVGLTLRLLNMMWGSPFEKPSTDSDMKSGHVGIAGYLIYICCSMAVSCNFSGARSLLKVFVISLTFVLLDVFVLPCSLSDMIATLVGLPGTITTALLPLFFLAGLSFVVFVFLDTWAEILLPSITHAYPRGVFVSIAGLTFMVMQTILGIPVEEPSIFCDMKAGLLDITDMINKYQGAYVVIKSLTVLVIPLLSRESRPIMYTTAAFIVAISLLPPGPGTPTEYPASTLVTDDFVQKTITSFVTSQINGVDGEIMQLTDS